MKTLKTSQQLRFAALIIFLLFTFTSCLTPAKIDRWTKDKYEANISNNTKKSDYLSVQVPGASAGDAVSATEKRKMKLLPLLFYWQWEYGTSSTLNKSIAAQYFNSTLTRYAAKLKAKLNNQKLELTVEQVPTSFSVIDHGGLVFLLLAYVSWDDIYMNPSNQDMIITYKVYNDSLVTKTGTITVSDLNRPSRVKIFHSVKRTFWKYLDQYNEHLTTMSREAMDKLMNELSQPVSPAVVSGASN